MPRFALVTGASTGIGRACALRLARGGFEVFAGVRRDTDGEELVAQGGSGLTPVILDVADQASIASCLKTVAEATEGHGLAGLVNNAGISVQGPLEYLDIADLRKQLEVNVIGQIAVTQAFLPALRTATGRIVFMSSIAGRTRALPLLGPYSASKSALESLAQALRIELQPWGLSVSIVQPGAIATPIWAKGDDSFDEAVDALPEEGRARYGDVMAKGRDMAAGSARRGIPPDEVAKKVEHALTADRPRFYYLVGKDAIARAFTEPVVPERLRDRLIDKALGHR